MSNKDIGGRLTQGFCGCGRPTVSKGVDINGKRRYRNRCGRCIYQARKQRVDKCNWCGVKQEEKGDLQIDHIDGEPSNNNPENIQTLCFKCHIRKTIINKDWKPKNDNKKM